ADERQQVEEGPRALVAEALVLRRVPGVTRHAGRASYPPPRSTTTAAGHASERRREPAALERPGRVLRDLVPGRVRGRGPAREVRRAPWLLHHLPLPARVAHANSEIACTGWVSVDGVRRELDGAPTVQKHIWGTRRVDELYWLYCPRFDEEVAACLEATAVRLRRRPGAPRLVPIWFRTAHSVLDRCGLAALAGNRVEVRGPARLEFRSTSATRSLRVEASCDPRTLAGYVYRDPAGWDVHVAQSDVASVTLELRRRPHPLAAWHPPRRLTCTEGAALELHVPEPLPGVRYLGWDATGA